VARRLLPVPDVLRNIKKGADVFFISHRRWPSNEKGVAMRVHRIGLAALSMLLLLSTRAFADPITIAIANVDHLRAVPGSALTLFGTLTNNTMSILNVNSSGGALNINNPPGARIVLDATFHIRWDLDRYLLLPGQMTGLIPLLTLFINPAAPDPSQTNGSIEICGGLTPAACDQLGRVFYGVAVSTAPPAPTPEPTTLLLFTSGLAVVLGRRFRAVEPGTRGQ
jgi:hypothetical protein